MEGLCDYEAQVSRVDHCEPCGADLVRQSEFSLRLSGLLVGQELAGCLRLPIERLPHLEASAHSVRPDLGATDAGVESSGRDTGVDVFFAVIGLREAYIHFEIGPSVADGEPHRKLAVPRGPRFREPVFAQQEREPGARLSHEGRAADIHPSSMPARRIRV